MSSDFVILSLSDAHIGKRGTELDSLTVLESLLKDVTHCRTTYGLRPNLIIFTGDIVFGQQPGISIEKQYDEADKFIKALYDALEAAQESIPILIVPGNHDINRDKISTFVKDGRNSLSAKRVDEILQDRTSLDWNDIFKRQDAWFNFLQRHSKHWTIDETFLTSRGFIDHNGITIGVVGLNSSWASHEQDEQNKIWVGRRQYETAYHDVKNADFRIIASHHPISWLHPEERNFLKQRIPSHFHLYLHGHDHDEWFVDQANHLTLEVGACYEGSTKMNSYCWSAINFETKIGTLYLREYCDAGSGGWRPRVIPTKTDVEGKATVKHFLSDLNVELLPTSTSPELSIITPQSVLEYIEMLQDQFDFRWERRNFIEGEAGKVYWPVRLRKPTPIHATQSFAAAGLQKQGYEIHLWLDDLGNTKVYRYEFEHKIREWFQRAGGVFPSVIVKTFSSVKENPFSWTMVQKWLAESNYSTPKVLKISKIIKSIESEASIVEGINKYKPRRLMTPAMVWACLLTMHNEFGESPIITLGGNDEKELWNAWWDCSGIGTARVGNLLGPELKDDKSPIAVHMKETDLWWPSKKDIKDHLLESLADKGDKVWRDDGHLVPWCINNCVLLPSRICNHVPLITINGVNYHSLDEIKHLNPIEFIDDIVDAIYRWLD